MKKLRNIVIIILILITIIIGGFYYAKFEYRNIKFTNLTMNTTKNIANTKIIFASDFQYDLGRKAEYLQEDLLKEVVNKINKENPDIIFLGGDYLNFAEHTDSVVSILGQLKAPKGVYGVLGNHDYLAKSTENLIEKFATHGIVILENKEIDLEQITICGVADLWQDYPTVENCRNQNNPQNVNILLNHNPDFFEQMTQSEKDQFDLVLSGHLHAGQITFFGWFAFPGIVPSDYGEKYRYGLKNYDGNYIYISSGLGGSVMTEPLRFGAQPEIVIIELTNGQNNILFLKGYNIL